MVKTTINIGDPRRYGQRFVVDIDGVTHMLRPFTPPKVDRAKTSQEAYHLGVEAGERGDAMPPERGGMRTPELLNQWAKGYLAGSGRAP